MKHEGRSKNTGFFRGHLAGLCVWALSAMAVAGCNEHPVGGGDGPQFRGITVPLPPPSFRGATIIDIEFSGEASGFEGERVLAWDTKEAKGVARPVDAAGNFVLPSWALNLQRHCVELRGIDSLGNTSPASYYALSLSSGPACQSPLCSAQDQGAECVCLVQRSTNCVDDQPWPGVGTEAGSAAQSSE